MDQKVIFCSNISNNYAEKTIEEIIFSRKKSASYWYHVVLYSVLAYWICLVNCQKCFEDFKKAVDDLSNRDFF